MLLNLNSLHGNKLAATDGDIGHVKDFFFDDKTWVIRYLVADTGTWLTGRLVLISPHAFGRVGEVDAKAMLINLSRQQIENSPPVDSHSPVSRLYEIEYYKYYGWPAYWNGGAMWGFGGFPVALPPSVDELDAHQRHHNRDDKHLRSTRAFMGYNIQALDGLIGHVGGLIVDDATWAVRKIAVEAGHWYSAKEILIVPGKVERISHEESKVFVNLTKEDIRQASESELATVAGGARGHEYFRD
jgi:hypothetical protein